MDRVVLFSVSTEIAVCSGQGTSRVEKKSGRTIGTQDYARPKRQIALSLFKS